jgi:predicted transcriptional regulator YdeE
MEVQKLVEIIQTYKQRIPALRFIGIKYGDEDRVNGGFGTKWEEWFETDRFHELESFLTDDFKSSYEDFNTNIGLMRWKEGEAFEYYIGMFLPTGTEVPDGYESIDFPESHLGVCWVKGTVPEVFGNEHECANKLADEGYELVSDEMGAWWFFERYGCPRFTEADESGKVILDICHFVK